MALLRSIATVGGYTLTSRLLGFIRDILLAAILGAGAIADAFFVAFKLPNFFRRLFAEGAFNAAFVPMFAGFLEKEGKDAAQRFGEEVLAVLFVALAIFVALAEIAMPWLLYVLAPGFVDDPERYDFATQFTRITFPYLLFISLVSLMGGVLNSLGRFAAVAATPILLNLTLIGSLLILVNFTATPGHALAIGVTIAGLGQFLWLVVALKRTHFPLRLRRPRLTPDVKRFLSLLAPGAVGAGIVQINLFVDIILASLLPTGAISYLYYADRLNQLPLGVVGIAVGTALLPLLSRQIRGGDAVAANASQNRAIEVTLFLTLPAAVALFLLSEPIIRVLFERGAFGAAETEASALTLMAYTVGLPAYVLVKVLAPGFFARENTTTPVKIAGIAVVINIVFSVAMMIPFAQVGIALATAIASWFNASLLAIGLWRRRDLVPDDRLKKRLPRMMLAALAMGGLAFWVAGLLEAPLMGSTVERGLVMLLLVAGGGVTYLFFAHLLGAFKKEDLRTLFRKSTLDQAEA
ncbi:MAG: murein biosynthesis integral membrane protein MurJ [Alphaproteobacteria bacterium]|nr:murein biosynthesis integral membrane protein MurJ [Alphaproteobacteria bacterium]